MLGRFRMTRRLLDSTFAVALTKQAVRAAILSTPVAPIAALLAVGRLSQRRLVEVVLLHARGAGDLEDNQAADQVIPTSRAEITLEIRRR